MTLAQLRARLRQLRADTRKLVEAGNDDDQEAIDANFAEIAKIQGQIDHLVALEDDEEEEEDEGADVPGRRTSGRDRPSPATARDNREDDPTRGFASMAEFGNAVRRASVGGGGTVDDRLRIVGAPTDFHRERGGANDEGFLVPPAYSQRVAEIAYEDDDLLGRVNPEPTGSNFVKFERDETTPWGATGIKANWEVEGKKFSPSKIALNSATAELHKLYVYVLATEEILEDAPRLNSRLTTGSGEAIRWKANEAIADGNGNGMPLGYRNSGVQITVAKEGGQAAASLVVDNLSKMYARSTNPTRSYWRANVEIFPALIGLVIGNTPVWTPPSTGISGAPGGFILGRPVVWTEHNEALGTQGDIEFIDPLGYYAAVRQGGPKFASSMHLYFDYDIQAFRWTFRMGGQPLLSKPVQPNKGSATKSPFIRLATRA